MSVAFEIRYSFFDIRYSFPTVLQEKENIEYRTRNIEFRKATLIFSLPSAASRVDSSASRRVYLTRRCGSKPTRPTVYQPWAVFFSQTILLPQVPGVWPLILLSSPYTLSNAYGERILGISPNESRENHISQSRRLLHCGLGIANGSPAFASEL